MFGRSKRSGRPAAQRQVDADEPAARAARARGGRAPSGGRFVHPGLAGALSLGLVVSLAWFCGIGWAAARATQAARSAARLVAPPAHEGGVSRSLSAGGDQYRPGYGFGDPNHNHSGPPGLTRPHGDSSEALHLTTAGKVVFVRTSFTIDEQAHLTISVLAVPSRQKLLLTQSKSLVGKPARGRSTKNLQYLVLVPRTIPLRLAIPAGLLVPGRRYTIRIVAPDADGAISRLLIPFVV